MEGKSLHMADFGSLRIFLVYTLFTYSKSHHSYAVILSKNNVGINMPKILDALKCFMSTKTMTMTMFTPSFIKVYIFYRKIVYTKFTLKVYTKFT